MAQRDSTPAGGWDITTEEEVRFNKLFESADPTNTGYLSGKLPPIMNTSRVLMVGGICVAIFRRSGLPDDVLSRIWDLADIENRGELSKDTFAVAMHLITLKLRTGKALPA